MNNKKIVWRRYLLGALLTSFLLLSSNSYAVNPCEMNTSMTGGQTAQNGGTHSIAGGFNYEMWTNSGANASMQYAAQDGMFQFKANWNNPDDLLCRIGLYWGNGPKYTGLGGDLHCDFNYDFTGTGGGYNYIGIYGWTKVPNEVEYYIVENTFFGSTAKQQGLYYNANSKGTYTLDGDTYEVFVGTRTNAPSISGTSTFTQCFAVRKTPRKCGHISITEHFKKWEQMGVTLGVLYDCKFLCEVGSGSGSFDMKYGNVWIGDADNNSLSFDSPTSSDAFEEGDEVTLTLKSETKSPVSKIDVAIDGKNIASLTSSPWSTKWTATVGNHTATATATLQDGSKVEASAKIRVNEPQGPYKEAISIPGKVEAENFDKGGAGSAYEDSDEKNEGNADFRTDEYVDIVKSGNGMAVGYTTASEWLEYTINVTKAGEYAVAANMSNGSGDPKITLYSDGTKLTSITGKGTSNDWDIYTEAIGKVTLTAGKHILKVQIDAANTNLDYISITNDGQGSVVDPTDPDPITTTGGNYFTNDDYNAYFGPECEKDGSQKSGAFYTGNYPSPFKTYLGKSDAEIQEKLDGLWNHYFKGGDNAKIYYDKGDGTAYVKDINNNDVRSEGQSYGMMICVQTNHKAEFDKLWAFAKKNMLHTSGQWDGYFKWKVNPDGSSQDANCAPDGEMYFVTSLLLAANRWNDDSYRKDAQYSLSRFWKNGNGSLFNESHNIITFQPYNCSNFGDPSYDLPAYVELFSRWSSDNNDKWNKCISATRGHLKASCHSTSGLFADYAEFDGNPTTGGFSANSNKYMYDAMRCAMNVGMDYYLFGADKSTQSDMMGRLINHFEKDGYSHARFNWDGSGASESYTLGEAGANAVGCFALMDNPANESKIKTNLEKAWNGQMMTGQYRYYDGLVHYLAMLHLCGSFKIYKPAPVIENKTVEGSGSVTYLGTTYEESTKITAFEDCQLYNVNIQVNDAGVGLDESLSDGKTIALIPNPATDYFTVVSADAVRRIEIVNMVGQLVCAQEGDDAVRISLPAGTYFVQVYTVNGKSVEKLQVK